MRAPTLLRIALPIVAIAGVSAIARADIYQYVDAQGVVGADLAAIQKSVAIR